MRTQLQLIYHLASADYFHRQPQDRSYLPENFAVEGFIHCTSDLDTLLEIANAFFANLADDLLVLEIDPTRLTAPLKFEPPTPPALTGSVKFAPDSPLKIALTPSLSDSPLPNWERGWGRGPLPHPHFHSSLPCRRLGRSHVLFPHIYGPLNRQAITRFFALQRDTAGKWRLPIITNQNQES